MKKIDVIGAALVMTGAVNWGLAERETSVPSSLLYGLVGVAGVYQAPAVARS